MSDFTTFLDESGTETHFIVGGITSTPERWKAFSDDWKVVLEKEPAIPFFKFSNIHHLSKKDHGGKIDAGIELINKYGLRADATIFDIGEYEVYFQGLIGKGHDTPMLAAYMQGIQQAALHCPEKDGQMRFVFDTLEKLQFADLTYSFALFRQACPNEQVKARLTGAIECQDDKTTYELQAADLWVGLVNASVRQDEAAKEFLKRITIPNRAFSWDGETLPELLGRSVRRNPDIISSKFYEDKGSRKVRLRKWIALDKKLDGDSD